MPRRTKIVATVGPASSSAEMLTKLIRAGADVFRVNCSHGTPAEHQRTIRRIRKISRELETSVEREVLGLRQCETRLEEAEAILEPPQLTLRL